jgi:hypothetical protein
MLDFEFFYSIKKLKNKNKNYFHLQTKKSKWDGGVYSHSSLLDAPQLMA